MSLLLELRRFTQKLEKEEMGQSPPPTPATDARSIRIPLRVVIGASRDGDAVSYTQTSLQLSSEWNALLRI